MASKNDEIRQMAYRLWEEEGRPEGKSLEHWERAAAMLDASTTGATTAVAATRAPAKAKPVTATKKPAAGRSGKVTPKP
jgi:hypothetical protein